MEEEEDYLSFSILFILISFSWILVNFYLEGWKKNTIPTMIKLNLTKSLEIKRAQKI